MSKALQDSRSHTRSRFFVTMAVSLLVLAFVGFAPTFYLKSFFTTPELPWYIHLHGASLSAWFILFLTQNMLIATRRPATHRRLGMIAGVAAVLLILTTFYVILNAAASTAARGKILQQPIEFTVLGDLSVLASFTILTSVGFSFRHRLALHKRAMLLANIALVTPAIGRIARFPVFAEAGIALVLGVMLSLLLAIWVHDFRSEKRVLATTIWGSALVFGGMLAGAAFASTESGRAFVSAISLGSR